MKKFVILITFALAFGCAKKAENANAEANSNAVNVPAVSQFAEITEASTAIQAGDRLLDDNQTELAIEAFKRAVEIDPDAADAYFKMGIAYSLIEKEKMRTGTGDVVPGDVVGKNPPKTNSDKMFELAVKAYKKMVVADPKNAVAHFNLGRSYNKLNKDDEAEDSLSQAVKLSPEDSEYQTELGFIRIKLAKYREALIPLKKALDIDPDNSEAAELLEDAEAGAKRVEFNQPDNTSSDKKVRPKAESNSNSESGTSGDSNTATKPPANNSKDDPKKPQRPTPKPSPKRQ